MGMFIAKRRCCLFVVIIINLILLHWPAAQPSRRAIAQQTQGTGDFCSRSLRITACPIPPTVDTLDLSTFLGSYYVVWSTAKVKFKDDLGTVCSRTNFSLDGHDDGNTSSNNGVTTASIRVVTSAEQVMGWESMSSLNKMGSYAGDVCWVMRQMCHSLLLTNQNLPNAMTKMQYVIQQPYNTTTSTHSLLQQASDMVNSSMANLLDGLDNLASLVSRVSYAAALLNQGADPVDALVGGLRESARTGSQSVTSMVGEVMARLSSAYDLIGEASADLATRSVRQLQEAQVLISQQISVLNSQAAHIGGDLSNIQGPLADMILADRVSTNTLSRPVSLSERAIQSSDKPGILAVSKQKVYNIIGMDELPFIGYSSALIYSCQMDSSGVPNEELILLSRTPTVSSIIVDRYLAIARLHGIYTDCDNTLVPSLQREGTCGIPS